jgi:hypothetical protein
MAIVRHTALNLLLRAKPTVSVKNRGKRSGWNVDYLESPDPADHVRFKRFA